MDKKELTDKEKEEIESWRKELESMIAHYFPKEPDLVAIGKMRELCKKIENKGISVTWSVTIEDVKTATCSASVKLWIPQNATIQ